MLFEAQPSWFAIQVKPGSELNIASMLKSKGYEEFVPTFKSERGRRGPTERALFSGYVFCRFDPVVRAPIVTTPGVIRVVGYGKSPAIISDSEMQAVRAVANSNLPARPYLQPTPGHKVRICDGPLRGVEGDIVQGVGRQCLVVSISMLQRSIAVEIESAWLDTFPISTTIHQAIACGGF